MILRISIAFPIVYNKLGTQYPCKVGQKSESKTGEYRLSESELAYELGFQHSTPCSKLFKTKTNLYPLEFRHSF